MWISWINNGHVQNHRRCVTFIAASGVLDVLSTTVLYSDLTRELYCKVTLIPRHVFPYFCNPFHHQFQLTVASPGPFWVNRRLERILGLPRVRRTRWNTRHECFFPFGLTLFSRLNGQLLKNVCLPQIRTQSYFCMFERNRCFFSAVDFANYDAVSYSFKFIFSLCFLIFWQYPMDVGFDFGCTGNGVTGLSVSCDTISIKVNTATSFFF